MYMTGLFGGGSTQDDPDRAIGSLEPARISLHGINLNPNGGGPDLKWVALKHLDSEDAPAPSLEMS